MTKEEALAALAEVQAAMREQYPDNPSRLEQLDAALSTAGMVVEHLADEDVRHRHDPVAHSKAIGEYVRKD